MPRAADGSTFTRRFEPVAPGSDHGTEWLRRPRGSAGLTPPSGTRFENHIKRRLRGAADSRKSAFQENLGQAPFACLRPKSETDFLAH